MGASEASQAIFALVSRLERLKPLTRDPEAYFLERGDVAAGLKRVARALAAPDPAAPAKAERGVFTPGALAVNGRVVPVSVRKRRNPPPGARAA
jgi:hypothetical protein